MLTCATLLETYPDLWRDATRHPFLDRCQAGTIEPHQFNTWLIQDYIFVTEFTRFLANGLAAAPVSHFDILLGGLNAIQDELAWFRNKAAERGLSLDSPPQTTCETYCQLLASWSVQPYAVQATALWAIELAYNQGWQLPGAMVSPYDEFAQRWGNPGFTDYVKYLEKQADESLAEASETVQRQAEAVFQDVARQEQAFWQMAFVQTS
ncbi:TenA family transcriptional regulator [Sodalinema gerasimenkoae]|uniref:TenA family transcriptional regulator n=1 Tax=Sodalinema gerasimenkoae TaxID=2862348 RepID=UPI00135AEBAC|nr:TenA family transcriptional regulator [Sodalinema gerasimenkoae]